MVLYAAARDVRSDIGDDPMYLHDDYCRAGIVETTSN
jgi:hypothetical protein